MDWQKIYEQLRMPFAAQDVDWRVQRVTSDKANGLIVAYLNARAIQTRMDEVVGPGNWKAEFYPWHAVEHNGKRFDSQLCTISIYDDERQIWVPKTDGAEDTDYEPVKGGLSDSYKRAAVQWCVGRYLYNLPTPIFAHVRQAGKTYVIADGEYPKLMKIHDDLVIRMFGKDALERARQQSHARIWQGTLSPAASSGANAASAAPESSGPQMKRTDAEQKAANAGNRAIVLAGPRYTVTRVLPRKFRSVDALIVDIQKEDGDILTAFVLNPDTALQPGSILTNARFKRKAGTNDKLSFIILESYTVETAQNAA